MVCKLQPNGWDPQSALAVHMVVLGSSFPEFSILSFSEVQGKISE